MSGNLLINCPICDRENQVSAVRDKKIIVCRNCGAPIYDTTRPANENDISSYQAILKQWGEQYRKSNPDRLQKQIESKVSQNQHEVKIAALNEEISRLQNEVKDWQKKCKYDEERYQSALSESKSKLAALTQQYTDLQTDVSSQKRNYQQAQNQYLSLQENLINIFEDFHNRNTEKTHSVDSILIEFNAKWEEVRTIESAANDSIENALRRLLPDDCVINHADESHRDGSVLETREDPVNITDAQSVPTKESKDGSAVPSIDDDFSISPVADSLESAVSDTKSEIATQGPQWMMEYNELSLNEARSFRERYDARRLTISQNNLAKQRVTFDEITLFVDGLGSYWCIYDAPTSSYILVLDKEKFSFNSSNYESITVCYDFNALNQSNLKDFDSSHYDLNDYKIEQPAQVVPKEEHGQWQLHQRGRLSFTEKPPL